MPKSVYYTGPERTEPGKTYMEHWETRIEYVVIALGAVPAVGCTDCKEELVGPRNWFRVSWIHAQSATCIHGRT